MNLNYFFAVFALTIVIMRIGAGFWPKHGPKIFGVQTHHYMHGLILIGLSFLFWKSILLPVGSALVVDEIPLFFIFKGWDWPDNHWKQYHSWQSVISIAAMTAIGYIVWTLL